MATVTTIEEVDWLYTDHRGDPNYRRCDCCSEAGYHDLWVNRPMRTFYRIMPECLCVCEDCLPDLLREEG